MPAAVFLLLFSCLFSSTESLRLLLAGTEGFVLFLLSVEVGAIFSFAFGAGSFVLDLAAYLFSGWEEDMLVSSALLLKIPGLGGIAICSCG